MRLIFMTLCFGFVLLSSCKGESDKTRIPEEQQQTEQTDLYTEKFRPQFHFSPPEKWMNDPNGLVYHDGIYHLFYQYYPEDIVWGPMHWGHAVSEDLVSWKNKPIALYPDKFGYIFSGSAVVDKTNSSGFGTLENPPLVAMFTYHSDERVKLGTNDHQTQGIAYSLDNGDTWTKYEGNPVIGNEGMMDFRDPKVFWHNGLEKWVLILVAGDYALFYHSDNLKDWELKSEFGKNRGAHGGVWECPDLFKLPVENGETEKWVLLISINPGGPHGGSATQYFVGDFDGTTFTTDQKDIKWLDLGADNYAGITFNNAPTDDRLFIGWMSNWLYAQKVPTKTWRSAMTLPRTLKLFTDNNDYYLKNYPIEAFDDQHYNSKTMAAINLEAPVTIENSNFNASDIRFMMNLSEHLRLEFSNANNDTLVFQLSPKTSEIIVNREQSGQVDFEPNFANNIQPQFYQPQNRMVEVRLIMDAASLEIFIDKGKYAITNTMFPSEPYTSLTIESEDGNTLENLTITDVKSIWNNEK
ncbi:MAG: glycoside hydrolase family 32 protein [Algicola sp.]|nr:glycoside hydrolase family 32 protein [Algicola sp.]